MPKYSQRLERALARCDYYVDVQLWPTKDMVDPEGWARNFITREEQDLAAQLLEGFTYFSTALTNQLFVAAFQSLSARTWQLTGGSVKRTWRSFFDRAVVTHVEGEEPKTTDSGYTFARRTRQVIGIEEDSILAPDDALAEVRANPARPLVFVDDLVGSGKQFVKTWHRPRRVSSTVTESFHELASSGAGEFYYAPLVCTDVGRRMISQNCPQVVLSPAHLLGPRDRALSTHSRLWTSQQRSEALRILKATSIRAGIPLKGPYGWRGFWGLGLTLAFEHSTPDATLPIYYWEHNGWTPLVRKL